MRGITQLERQLYETRWQVHDLERAITSALRQLRSRDWIFEGRGSYAWNDDDYRREAAWALGAVENELVIGLRQAQHTILPWARL